MVCLGSYYGEGIAPINPGSSFRGWPPVKYESFTRQTGTTLFEWPLRQYQPLQFVQNPGVCLVRSAAFWQVPAPRNWMSEADTRRWKRIVDGNHLWRNPGMWDPWREKPDYDLEPHSANQCLGSFSLIKFTNPSTCALANYIVSSA